MRRIHRDRRNRCSRHHDGTRVPPSVPRNGTHQASKRSHVWLVAGPPMLAPRKRRGAGAERALRDRLFAATEEKRYRTGTHRMRPPGETLALLEPHLSRFGITRVANITGTRPHWPAGVRGGPPERPFAFRVTGQGARRAVREGVGDHGIARGAPRRVPSPPVPRRHAGGPARRARKPAGQRRRSAAVATCSSIRRPGSPGAGVDPGRGHRHRPPGLGAAGTRRPRFHAVARLRRERPAALEQRPRVGQLGGRGGAARPHRGGRARRHGADGFAVTGGLGARTTRPDHRFRPQRLPAARHVRAGGHRGERVGRDDRHRRAGVHRDDLRSHGERTVQAVAARHRLGRPPGCGRGALSRADRGRAVAPDGHRGVARRHRAPGLCRTASQPT